MKKRKPSYLLIGILAVALGAVVFMNATAASPNKDLHAEDLQPTPTITDPKASVLETMKNTSVKDGTSMRPLIKPVKLPEGEAKLAKPVRRAIKPMPEKGELSSQWYPTESSSGR